MTRRFLPEAKDDDKEFERSFRVPCKRNGKLSIQTRKVKMSGYRWRLLEWMEKTSGIGASFIFHHCDVVDFQKWDKISGFFEFFIDDWIAYRASARAAFRLVSDQGLVPAKVPE